jgi:ribosome-associated protein
MMKERSLDAETLARYVANELADKQAEAIVLIDISVVSGFADFFVIASAASSRQFEALAEAIEEPPGRERPRREGTANSGWQLFDYGDVVVHIFGRAEREYYDLDGMWSSGKQLLRVE